MKKGLYGPFYSFEITSGIELIFSGQSAFTLERRCVGIV
jgi:hypothetical protein